MKTALNRNLMLPRLNRNLLSILSLAVLCAMAFTFTNVLVPMMHTASAQHEEGGAGGAMLVSGPPPCFNPAVAALRAARATHAAAQEALAEAQAAYDRIDSELGTNPIFAISVFLPAAIALAFAHRNLQVAADTLAQAQANLNECVEP